MTTTLVHSITDKQLDELEGFLAEAESLGPMTDCETVMALITRLREAEKDAARYQWLINQGDSTQWMNIIRLDPDDFDTINEAIDTAMQGEQ